MTLANLNTYGGLLRDIGYEGEVVDDNPVTMESKRNEGATAIQFGYAVARGVADDTCKAPSSSVDQIIGIAAKYSINAVLGFASGGTNLASFKLNDEVPVMKKGFIFARPLGNVNRGDKVVAVTASNGQLDSLVNSTDNTMDANPAAAPLTKAFGNQLMIALPSDGDTVTLGGSAVTFKAASPTGLQSLIGVDIPSTMYNLYAVLSASVDSNLVKFKYSLSPDQLTIYLAATTGGYAGNALTEAVSNSASITVSGATLTGGTGNKGNGTLTLDVTTPVLAAGQPGTYLARCTTLGGAGVGTFTVYDPEGVSLGTYVDGASAFATQIKFVTAAGATAWAVGDFFTITVLAGGSSGRVEVPRATWETTTAAGQVGKVFLA